VEGDVYEPEPDLVAAARAGELRAFEELVRRYQADVWRLCFHLLHDETLTDDVTQDVFIRLYRFLPSFRLDSKFSTWMLSIARNSAVDELRRLGRRRRLTQRIEAHTIQRTVDETIRVEIREALAELPIELREPLVLIDMFGLSYRETARVIRAPVGTIKSRVHRARELLAQILAPKPGEGAGEG
jgi:RNA polymerase sigma-70 factor (ECF subfamily)